MGFLGFDAVVGHIADGDAPIFRIAGSSDASRVKASGVTAKVGLFGHARENSHGLEVAYAAVFENVIRVLTQTVLKY